MLDAPMDTTGIGFVTLKVPGNDIRGRSTYQRNEISTKESLIHDGVYELMVAIHDNTTLTASFSVASLVRRLRGRLTDAPVSGTWTTLSRYQLGRQPMNAPVPLRSTFKYQNTLRQISAAGYGLASSFLNGGDPMRLTGIMICAPDKTGSSQKRALPLPEPDPPRNIQMALTSAVMFRYDSRIVVCHYL
jgi:hypothetical protein